MIDEELSTRLASFSGALTSTTSDGSSRSSGTMDVDRSNESELFEP